MAMEQKESEDRADGLTFHLTPEMVWEAQREETGYLPEAFADEGFIHTTNDDVHVLEVANRYYRDDPRPYLLLDVDLAKVAATTVYEAHDVARRYPHIYGPIDRRAVILVRRLERGGDGEFKSIGASAGS